MCDAAQTEREARGVGNSVHLVHERCRVVAVSVVLAGWNRTQDVSALWITLDVARFGTVAAEEVRMLGADRPVERRCQNLVAGSSSDTRPWLI